MLKQLLKKAEIIEKKTGTEEEISGIFLAQILYDIVLKYNLKKISCFMLKFNGVSTQFEAVKINTKIQQENL